MPGSAQLPHRNPHQAFPGPDPERRRAAIGRTCTEDVTFTDPDGELAGWQPLSDQAQKLPDGLLAGYLFGEDGPASQSLAGSMSSPSVTAA